MAIYKKNTDNRMHWIREMERTKKKSKKDQFVYEHEIVSECDIRRVLHSDDDQILCWSLFGKNAYIHSLHTYVLRIVSGTADPHEYTEDDQLVLTASRKGYFSESCENELISLLSLALHTRFFYVHTTTHLPDNGGFGIATRHGAPFTYHPCASAAQRKSRLFSGEGKDLYLATEVLDAVKKLPTKHHLRFYRAVANYADGVRRIGEDDQLSYLRLVSAIEAMSERTGEKKKQFVDFIVKHGDGYFEGRRSEPEHICVARKNLIKVAGAIYKARSDFLHDGEAMWISDEMGDKDGKGRGWDYDGSVGMQRDQHVWVNKEHLPTVLFFEELVRHCLLNYLDPSLTNKFPL